ncbi:MAG: response regulator [Myxococcota bacterium]
MNILIADDSKTMARLLGAMVSKLGHQVVGHAPDGAEAVRMAMELAPDLVFLDILMPEMTGLEALRIIRARNKRIQVIVVSSVSGVGENLQKAVELGAIAVLSKPIKADDVRKALEACTAGS